MGRDKERTEAAVSSTGHQRPVFCLTFGPVWAANPPGCQHGVDACAQRPDLAGGQGLPGGPVGCPRGLAGSLSQRPTPGDVTPRNAQHKGLMLLLRPLAQMLSN